MPETHDPDQPEESADDARVRRQVREARVDIGDTDAAWMQVSKQMQSPGVHAPSPHVGIRVRWPWVASLSTLALGLCLWGVLGTPGIKSAGAERQYAPASGQRERIRLPDGTQLILAPGSVLRVPENYGKQDRQIALDGEAYITVVHDISHPFAVRTHDIVTRDVGTTFDIRGYDEDDMVRVAVVEGAVAVVGAGRGTARGLGGSRTRPSSPTAMPDMDDIASVAPSPTMILHMGDIATVSGMNVTVQHAANVVSITSWLQGGLSFEDTPLPAVLRDVGRTYGVTLMLADSTLASSRVTAAFTGQPLDFVLNAIAQVVGAQYERRGNQIVIRKGTANAQGHGQNGPPPLTTARIDGVHE